MSINISKPKNKGYFLWNIRLNQPRNKKINSQKKFILAEQKEIYN